MRKVDVDELIVLDIDALESRHVISRRRCPVNNFQDPVVAVWVRRQPPAQPNGQMRTTTIQFNSSFFDVVKCQKIYTGKRR